MTETNKVSIIIPCYNHGQYLNECVNSVLNQTYQNIEIIIVDDGSTDSYTNELFKTYNPPKTKILRIKNNGVAYARNFAINNSRGEYILPLDADDKIAPTYLEKAVNILDSNESIGIVKCEVEFFGNKTGKWELPKYKFPHILLENCIVATSLFRKSDYLKTTGYNINMTRGLEDHDFWLSLLELGVGIHEIPETLFFYRQHNVSRNTQLLDEYELESKAQIFKNHKDLYLENIPFVLQHTFSPNYLKKHKYFNLTINLCLKSRLIICLEKR